MKNLYYSIFLLFIIACVHQPKKTQTPKTSAITKKDTVFADDKDSVTIDTEENYKVTKKELRQILKEYPEFKLDGLSPDDCYARQKGNFDFSCEICKDDYYRLYAYFQKERNGQKKYERERAILLKLYRDINFIYDNVQGGGTYYGHQYTRILGYAEYSIYCGKNNEYFIKDYSINKQKTLYIKSIQQFVTDELNSNDTDFIVSEKPALKKKLFKTVNEINGLITNTFYLKMAQRYQYSNY